MLVEAGPPPELPPKLEAPPALGGGKVGFLPRRRRGAMLVLAAAIAAIAFGAGYLAGAADPGGDSNRVLALHGTALDPDARGSIELSGRDDAGNWPMLVDVRGLKELGPRGYYEVLLERGGKVVGPCGSFLVQDGAAKVVLNAPYRIKQGDGWLVVVHPNGHLKHPPTAMTT
jgi:hypothetical protein